MKVLLLVGGALFLLLALLLFAAAVVVFFLARGRRAKAASAAQPPERTASQAPSTPPPAPAPEAPPSDPNSTVMLDMHRLSFGALHGLSGPVAGRVFPIDTTGFFIGRDRTLAQVIIESASVSKRHVWIGVRDGAVMAVDQSTNGTFLNDTASRFTETRLAPGDTLIISDDVARLVYRA